MATLDGQGWKSLKRDRGDRWWSETDCDEVVEVWLKRLPPVSIAAISADKHGPLGHCVDFCVRQDEAPTKLVLKRNCAWLVGVLQKSPSSTPSYFFIADCFLKLHQKLDSKLFSGATDQVRDFAVREANKLKTLISKARRLFTNNKNAKEPWMKELKRLLQHKVKSDEVEDVEAMIDGQGQTQDAGGSAQAMPGIEVSRADIDHHEAEPDKPDNDANVQADGDECMHHATGETDDDRGEDAETYEAQFLGELITAAAAEPGGLSPEIIAELQAMQAALFASAAAAAVPLGGSSSSSSSIGSNSCSSSSITPHASLQIVSGAGSDKHTNQPLHPTPRCWACFLIPEGKCNACANESLVPTQKHDDASPDVMAPFNMLEAMSAYIDASASLDAGESAHDLATYMNSQHMDRSLTPAIPEPGFLSNVGSALLHGRTGTIPVNRSGPYGCTPDKDKPKGNQAPWKLFLHHRACGSAS